MFPKMLNLYLSGTSVTSTFITTSMNLEKKLAYDSLAEQGTRRILELARFHNIDFVLTDESPPLNLPVVYTNSSYTIYTTKSRKKK